MKKLILIAATLLGCSFLSADWPDSNYVDYFIQKTTQTTGGQTLATGQINILIPYPGAPERNCITDLTVSANQTMVISVLDGSLTTNTTLYSMTISSGVPFAEHWDPASPLCGLGNSSMTISGMSAQGTTLQNTTYFINVNGFTKKKP